MTEIRSTRNGKTARVSPRLARALVKGGKYTYVDREMRPAAPSAPIVQPLVTTEKQTDVVIDTTQLTTTDQSLDQVEISPITGKPKRQYRRRAVQSTAEEE